MVAHYRGIPGNLQKITNNVKVLHEFLEELELLE
jgi:hypothetical protein